ncbi:hypothetical protein LWI29_023819 [Acer saccharum]|uniref:Uncharacterized protein n=1 Tax=Acer saccharum TaxID=4024 RepID=A0AA39SNV5_ACESA|nr:hypothetical protein LWI29_023819 [Acer saccharum]
MGARRLSQARPPHPSRRMGAPPRHRGNGGDVGPVVSDHRSGCRSGETVRWASRAAMLFFERRGTAHLGFRSFQRIRRAFVTMASALGRASKRRVLRSVKKLVVGPWVGSTGPPRGVHRSARPFCRRCAPGLNWPGRASGAVTLKKLECSKQAYALDTLAWDNIIGFRSYSVGLRDRSND